MHFRHLTCIKTLFLVFTVIVILFSFSSVALASPPSDVEIENTNFLLRLFVPASDFFPNQIERLNSLVNDKLGGIRFLFRTLDDFWKSLDTGVRGVSFSVPDNYFFSGYRGITVNPLSQASVYIGFFRDLFSVFIAIITSIACYKKVITFFSV